MINEKRFINRIFGTILFAFFGFGFNSVFGAVSVVNLGQELVPSAGGYNTTYTQGVNEDGSFYLSNGSVVKNGLAFNFIYNYSSSYYPGFQFWGEYETGYALFSFAENRAGNASIVKQFRVYPYISMIPNKQPNLNCSATKPDNFTGNVCYYKDINELGEEYNGKFSGLYFDNNRQLVSCFIFEDMNEVFCPGDPVKTGNNTTVQWTGNAITFESFDESLVKYPSFITSSVSNGNSGTLIPINSDVDKVINYYETRFNWSEDMCYVGTNDLTSVYGTSGVDFYNGTGDTIFGLYYSLYNSYGSNIINNVGKFVNVWLLNYSQWFYEDTPKWIGVDNGPDTNVSYIYTGFTFPFANKPVAIYFMASNLYDGYTRESSQGVDMAFYCYSKLNYDNINDGTINYEEVKEQVSENILGRIDTYVNYHINPNTNNSQYQVPTSGSFWESFGTGYETTDIELDTTFSDFYTRITNIFQNYSPLYSTGIIPDYILYALIFLILFRIMKH